jgi:hypothetical protein
MPQPNQKHCKNFQTLELSLSKLKKMCLRPTTTCKHVA